MKVIVVDDELNALENMEMKLKQIPLINHILLYKDAQEALLYIKQESVNIAFLDIEMYEINGIVLAKHIKIIRPETNIIFITGFSQYAMDAFSLHASGYLLKPPKIESILGEINHLRNPMLPLYSTLPRIQCFGNFDIFKDNKPIKFSRSKSKELLAYLVDRKGARATTAELCAILWEEKTISLSLKRQFRTLLSDVNRSLAEVNCENILIKSRNNFSIDMNGVDCDHYQFLKGHAHGLNAYMYMSIEKGAIFLFKKGSTFHRD
ncbi:MAG: response regulator [Eubacteriaceae bacterium]